MKREVYSIRWVKRNQLWWCPQNGMSERHKALLVRLLATKLFRRWTFAHVPCQLRIYGKNGRTYMLGARITY